MNPDSPAEAGPIHLPAPTIWPNVVAAGVALLAFGVLTALVFTVVGLALMVLGLAQWVAVLRAESAGDHAGHGGHG